ncbi:MAG: hypothetical protein GY906_06850, partial [bacterium]|nr:hypothetical protein [bacterium]
AAADSILALREGKVVVQGPPSQILDQEVLKSIYDTRFELIQRPDSDLPLIVVTGGGAA